MSRFVQFYYGIFFHLDYYTEREKGSLFQLSNNINSYDLAIMVLDPTTNVETCGIFDYTNTKHGDKSLRMSGNKSIPIYSNVSHSEESINEKVLGVNVAFFCCWVGCEGFFSHAGVSNINVSRPVSRLILTGIFLIIFY